MSMKKPDIPSSVDPAIAVEISEKTLDEAIANANMRLAAHQSLVSSIEAKAMNFLTLIITVSLALFAAVAVSLSRPELYLAEIVLIVAAITCSVISALTIALKVLSHHSWYLPGQDPGDYLHPDKTEWARKTKETLGGKALNALYLKDLDYYLKYNLEGIISQTKAYRFSVSLFSMAISSFGLIYTVISCFLRG